MTADSQRTLDEADRFLVSLGYFPQRFQITKFSG